MPDSLRLAPAGTRHPAMLDPWQAAAGWGGQGQVVIALLTATDGPAYRDAGAAMAIHADGRVAGSITSGCVEADLILRAGEVRQDGCAQRLRYGTGSPFFDLRLPCGGGIQVLLFPLRDAQVLAGLAQARAGRRPVSMGVTAQGRLRLDLWRPTASEGAGFRIGFRPDLRFLIFGTGAEAAAFAGLAQGMGYDHLVASQDEPTLAAVQAAGSPVRRLCARADIDALEADADTAVILFYHDHDYEPEILRRAVATPAFYIGAQGSRATQGRRLARLEAMGMSRQDRDRIHGPVGLIPSSRDARGLAVSVLAQILQLHGQPSGQSDTRPGR